MKVLFASEYHHPNSVISSYIDGLTPHCELVCGLDNFWKSSLRFDIVHLQWPEELLGWHIFEQEDLERLKERLQYWKNSGAKIVITRHNALPHRDFALDAGLYECCFGAADAVVHLGAFSLDEFKNDPAYSDKINVMIHHPDYLNVPNNITKEEARKKLKIGPDVFLYLSFGAIRHRQEQEGLINAFKKVNTKNKQLLLTGSLYLKQLVSFRVSPKKNIAYKRTKLQLKSSGITIDETRNISLNDIQYYFNAADIVVIPRIEQLNSGVTYLAFSFSKQVVGPDTGNIGGLLKTTGNIVYTPGDADSFARALERSAALPHSIGAANYEYVIKECGKDKIGREHAALYQKLIS